MENYKGFEITSKIRSITPELPNDRPWFPRKDNVSLRQAKQFIAERINAEYEQIGKIKGHPIFVYRESNMYIGIASYQFVRVRGILPNGEKTSQLESTILEEIGFKLNF
ncbi:MAG: hypothetical protein KJ674_05040 [Nanoarchaeota archaeon]|nr:hypothetical protein [Nanoarchaeota archaeon]